MTPDQSDVTECRPEAFRSALIYLYEEAMAAGWELPAHLVAVAAEAMNSYCDDGTLAQCEVISFHQSQEVKEEPEDDAEVRPCQ